jgi:hypothetical protein
MFALIAGEFAEVRTRRRGRGYLLGLLSQSERKNGWTIAEFAGDSSPDGMQRLLNLYAWDADRVRDALARYVVRAMGDAAAVLVADETGFLKKGRMSAGVARQYTGTAGRVENCQVGVFLAYAAPDGSRALIDRELFLPEKWTADRDRCRLAGIPGDTGFETKPALAKKMVERAVAAGVPFRWVAADEVYGQNPGLRDRLEEQQIAYVMAVPCSQQVTTKAGPMRADELAARVPAGGWQVLSCGDGSKGPRLYEWALIAISSPDRHLLVRRSLHRGERRAGACLLHLLRAGRRHDGRAGRRSRRQVGGRGLLCRGQERDRAGPLPGPRMDRLVPARHAVDARPCVPGRPRPCQPARLPDCADARVCPCRRHRSKGDPQPVDNDSRGPEHIAQPRS